MSDTNPKIDNNVRDQQVKPLINTLSVDDILWVNLLENDKFCKQRQTTVYQTQMPDHSAVLTESFCTELHDCIDQRVDDLLNRKLDEIGATMSQHTLRGANNFAVNQAD